ncbi:hypothetical protein ACFPVX_02175 [Cohnella faecalis]|uniref:Uncharacterized protein n=1 Tax=Cohnella faecalis TaxID=2315694 RepID=A0A398CYC6_9BACL|nr:hypothetical protein [Cohnella faecalis]RIE04807.1 hypothetical protein D3H35_04885 [Cohnella faecalis]
MYALNFDRFRELSALEEGQEFREKMESAGYSSFYSFVEQFRRELQAYTDHSAAGVLLLIDRGRRLFPEPGRFSPSWDALWDELESVCMAKNETLAAIAPSEREGEWQVLIDNPYLPQQVVCYPALAFVDAVYLYAYFLRDLKPNEHLRLQKITPFLVRTGNRHASVFPTS